MRLVNRSDPGAPDEGEWEGPKFEHRVLNVGALPEKKANALLAPLGEQGWEAVCSWRDMLVLKRRRPDQ